MKKLLILVVLLAIVVFVSGGFVSNFTGRSVVVAVPQATETVSTVASVPAEKATPKTTPVALTHATSTTKLTSAFLKPNVVDNASFEGGWEGFVNWNNGVPFGDSLSITTAHSYDGTHSVSRIWTPNPTGDTGSQFAHAIPDANRVWVRFYFRLTDPISSHWKFARFSSPGYGGSLGGIFVENGNSIMSWGWDREDQAVTTWFGLSEAKVLDGKWHELEYDYWRNGDPSGYPSVAFWFDGKSISMPDGRDVRYSGNPNKSYWKNGRLYAGERNSNDKIAELFMLATLNGGNTTSGEADLDDIAVSTAGRIGP